MPYILPSITDRLLLYVFSSQLTVVLLFYIIILFYLTLRRLETCSYIRFIHDNCEKQKKKSHNIINVKIVFLVYFYV